MRFKNVCKVLESKEVKLWITKKPIKDGFVYQIGRFIKSDSRNLNRTKVKLAFLKIRLNCCSF